MDFHVSFRHFQKSSAVVERAEKRARRLCERFDPAGQVRAVFDTDGPGYRLDLTARLRGEHLAARGRDHDVYRLVDDVFNRLARQAMRLHDRQTAAVV